MISTVFGDHYKDLPDNADIVFPHTLCIPLKNQNRCHIRSNSCRSHIALEARRQDCPRVGLSVMSQQEQRDSKSAVGEQYIPEHSPELSILDHKQYLYRFRRIQNS